MRRMIGAALATVLAASPAAAQVGNVTGSSVKATGTAITQTLGVWTSYLAGQPNPNPLILIDSTPTLVTTYAAGGLTNGILLSSGGNLISYCPTLSCVTSPSSDHQRTSALFWSTTSDDGHSEEQTVAIQTTISTGYTKTWAQNTAYALGDNVRFPAANTIYRATTAGTSAASGTGPTGTGSAISDGTVVWAWINDSAIGAKVGLYNEVVVTPGGGQSWAQAHNIKLSSGVVPEFMVNTELDFTNDAANCVPGVANCIGLDIKIDGTFKSTTGINLYSTNAGAVFSTYWGMRLSGANLASDAGIELDIVSAVGIGFGASGIGTTSFSTAAIVDASTGLNGILMSGAKTNAVIKSTSTSPLVFDISGTHSSSVFADTSTSPAALNLSGTYSLAAIRTSSSTATNALIVANGQLVCFNDTDACLVHASGKLFYQVGGVNMFSVADGTGNAIFKGTVTASGTP